jgi:hypothetical protein
MVCNCVQMLLGEGGGRAVYVRALAGGLQLYNTTYTSGPQVAAPLPRTPAVAGVLHADAPAPLLITVSNATDLQVRWVWSRGVV